MELEEIPKELVRKSIFIMEVELDASIACGMVGKRTVVSLGNGRCICSIQFRSQDHLDFALANGLTVLREGEDQNP